MAKKQKQKQQNAGEVVKKKQPKQLKQLDLHKFSKRDNSWLAKLGDKRSKLLRKLVCGMKRFTEKEVPLPFDRTISSVDILYRGDCTSWFHDKVDTFKLLLRVNGLDEEGIGMHLTETAKVLQWILWAPLIGDPNTSRQAPDRVWRESTFTNPAQFLLSYVDDSKVDFLEELVGGRWDSGMMLGGAVKVKNLIYKHISDENEELKKSIQEWLRFLKWHQEFDWEEVSEYLLFGSGNTKFDVFWENVDYTVPESYTATTLWTPERPNIAQNIREIVAQIPGFENLKAILQKQAAIVEDVESTDLTSAIVEDVESKDLTFEDELDSKRVSSSQTPVRRPVSPIHSPTRDVFRPDLPYKGANKVAFESFFMRHTLWKSSPVGSRKRPFPYQDSPKRKIKKVKASKPLWPSRKRKSGARKKVNRKPSSKTKRKSKKKRQRKGSRYKNKKNNRRRY